MTTDPELVGRLALAIGRLSRRLRTVDGGLSHGLLSALSTITKAGPIRLADLSQREGVSAPNTTRLVSELEAQGLVSRAADPSDGRAFLIQVTADGENLILQARSARAALIHELLDQLGDDDAAALLAALPALERMAEEERASSGAG
jgi:DNA-binding MarR family transcriptional regulator